ncbi:atrial natriuretic peptide receptor 1-like isoform X2 [Lineus longissimus]|uniref:atrial natriuretic peptide receptor 1-like isoform X2 n=1 Tax=Lineus longissimus TaxID=88925 RepID=UPI00315D9DB3
MAPVDGVYILFILPHLMSLSASLDVRLGVFFSNQTNLASPWGYSRTAAAVSFALDQLRNESVIQDDVNITFEQMLYPTNEAGFADASGKVANLWLEHYDAMIGLSLSTLAAPAGMLASYFNIPFISWGAADYTLNDKSTFTTLVRTMGDSEKFGLTVYQIFQLYNWTTCAVYYRNSGICLYAMRGFRDAGVKQYNITISESKYWNSDEAQTDDDIDNVLERIKERARVVLVCGNNPDLRRIMIRAHANGMTSGEYIFITYGLLAYQALDKPWFKEGDDANNTIAKEAYKHVLHVSWAKGDDAKHPQFTQKMLADQLADRMAEPPWNYELTRKLNLTGSYISMYVYDCMYTYGLLLNKSIEQNLDYQDGEVMFNLSKGLKFNGITGFVVIDEDGDRQPDYWVWDYNETTGIKYHVLHISNEEQTVDFVSKIHWNTKDGKPPLDEPECGFLHERCPPDDSLRNSIIIGVVVCLVVVSCGSGLGFYQYRKKKQEEELSRMLWRVDFSDVRFSKYKRGLGSQASYVSMVSASRGSLDKEDDASGRTEGQLFALIAQYKNLLVCVRNINKDSLIITKADLVELNKMKGLSHDNINPFVGACVDPPNLFILFMYCSKGSLMDIVENDDIKLDNMFKASIIQDLTDGLHFLHASFLKSHGHLKSSNCVIDSRWVLKITDYGLNNLKANEVEDAGEHEKYTGLWWTAPELLCVAQYPLNGTPKGDIYSYAIILYEIIFRTLPYSTDNLSPREIVEKVRNGEDTPFRPQIMDGQMGPHRELIWLMKQGWQENPDTRPDMSWIKKKIKTINKGKHFNIMDHMINMMEKYTNNLEELVESRTSQLVQEKKKTDSLLYSMMPVVVADRLKTGQIVAPEMFDSATIFFSDIIGFSIISSLSTPMEIIDLLNDVYSLFDGIIKKFDVYKVETISDSYMVVGGIPKKIKHHCAEVADMALTLLSAVLKTTIRHLPKIQLQVRIGMHCGPCCAVNTTSRMETNGSGLRIHLSTQAYEALSSFNDYDIKTRGQIQIKGKGLQTTYWLLGKKGFGQSLPTERDLNPSYDENGLPVRTW